MVEASMIEDISESNPAISFHLNRTGTMVMETNSNGSFQIVR